MFIGHYSAAFIAKRAAPTLPLPVFFVACQVIDLFWGTLVLLGVEKLRVIPKFTATNGLDLYFMPYTHSLSSALIWSVGAALLFWLCTPKLEQRKRAAIVVGVVVSSHWMLDLLVHIPDLPLWFNSMKVGFGWWNYRLFALLLELALLWGSVLLCLQAAGTRRAHYLWLAAAMSVLQVASLYLQPDEDYMVALQLLGIYLLLTGVAWRIDRPHPQDPAVARSAI